MRLPTVKPSMFEMYMDWIYFKDLASNVTNGRTGLLIDLYLLGDMVDDKGLRNEVMAVLQTYTHETRKSPSHNHVCHIWENTAEQSLLRKWAFDRILLKQRNVFVQNAAKYPPEFVQQIASKLMLQTPVMSDKDFLGKAPEYQEEDDDA